MMDDEQNFEMNTCVHEDKECSDTLNEHEDIDDNDEFMTDEDRDSDDSDIIFDKDEHLDDYDDVFENYYSNVEHSFEILSIYEVTRHMEEVIERLSGLLTLPPITVRSLLAHFEWNEEKMLERYYSEDQEKLFAEAKIVNPYRESVNPELAELLEEKECPICACSVPYSELKSTVCGHGFCVECWATYLKVCILDQGLSPQITCPAPGCNTLLDDAFILSSEIGPKAKRMYKMAIIRDFVQRNRLLRWCPTPGCEKVMKVENVRTCRVICSCAFIYCFDCGQEWHEPVPCEILRSWRNVSEHHQNAETWIHINPKECPKCHIDLQKIGGCDTMTCGNCLHTFGWANLRPPSYIPENFRCSKKLEAKFYRFSGLFKVFEQARILFRDISDDFQYQSDLSEKTRALLLSKAANILSECRRTLMYSCIIEYHVETQQNNHSIIFKNHQDALESASDSLFECLLGEIEPDNMEKEGHVTELFRHCYMRWKILVEHIHKGIDKNWWTWSELSFELSEDEFS